MRDKGVTPMKKTAETDKPKSRTQRTKSDEEAKRWERVLAAAYKLPDSEAKEYAIKDLSRIVKQYQQS
jgi:hypothetical protein